MRKNSEYLLQDIFLYLSYEFDSKECKAEITLALIIYRLYHGLFWKILQILLPKASYEYNMYYERYFHTKNTNSNAHCINF